MEQIIAIIITIVTIRAVITLHLLNSTLNWYKLNSKTVSSKKSAITPSHHLYILIPALREQKRIIPTLEYFYSKIVDKSTTLIIITTEREDEKKYTGPSTKQLVEEYISREKTDLIRLIHYPYTHGVMAHQLNFAIKQLPAKCFIAIYNADSRPHPETINLFRQQLQKHPRAKIFQQSAAFIKNYDDLGKGSLIKKLFLQSLAILQTRWTLTHELPRILRQSQSNNKLITKYSNAHVVGHGLFIESECLKKVGGFPENSVTEDLFLGFLLRTSGQTIYPLPLLELGDSPETIKGNWQQKFVWFWGPMRYWYYIQFLKKKGNLRRSNRMVAYAIALQGLISAIAWLSSGFFITILLLSFILTDSVTIIVFSYLAVFIYAPLQFMIVAKSLNALSANSKINKYKATTQHVIAIGLMSIPAVIFHSIPPYFSVYNEIAHFIAGKKINKPKTDD